MRFLRICKAFELKTTSTFEEARLLTLNQRQLWYKQRLWLLPHEIGSSVLWGMSTI